MTKYIVVEKTESVLESLIKDAATFGFILLCIYVSWRADSVWWTFFTGSVAALWIFGIGQIAGAKKFRSIEELRKWLESQ